MAEKVYKNRVKEKYEKEVVPFLMKKFGYKSVMECPKLVSCFQQVLQPFQPLQRAFSFSS